jgi:hypothetical protein
MHVDRRITISGPFFTKIIRKFTTSEYIDFIKMVLKEGYRKISMRGRLPAAFIILLLLVFISETRETRANVYPEILTRQSLPVDIFNVHVSYSRDFHQKSDIPGCPAPVKPPQDQNKCFIQETFRLLADRGQNQAVLAYTGVFTGYVSVSSSLICNFPFVYISSRSGESVKIRPPPVI